MADRAAAAAARTEAASAEPGHVPTHPPGDGDRWEVLEAAYVAFRRAAATDRAMAEEVVARRLDWIDLDLEWVSFPEEATAREALLCLREDGDFSAVLFSGDTPAPGLSRGGGGPICATSNPSCARPSSGRGPATPSDRPGWPRAGG